MRAADPCSSLLTPSQLRSLGYLDPGVKQVLLGSVPSCLWKSSKPSRRLRVAVWTTRNYFIDVYRSRLLPVFRPTEVAGLPAVEQQNDVDSSNCATAVGVAEVQTLDVTIDVEKLANGALSAQPCLEGRRAIEAVVSTLPPL